MNSSFRTGQSRHSQYSFRGLYSYIGSKATPMIHKSQFARRAGSAVYGLGDGCFFFPLHDFASYLAWEGTWCFCVFYGYVFLTLPTPDLATPNGVELEQKLRKTMNWRQRHVLNFPILVLSTPVPVPTRSRKKKPGKTVRGSNGLQHLVGWQVEGDVWCRPVIPLP